MVPGLPQGQTSTEALALTLQSTGFSLLAPNMIVYYGSSNSVVGQHTSTSLGDTYTLTIPNVSPVAGSGNYYTVAVSGNASYCTGGQYALTANFGTLKPNTYIAQASDGTALNGGGNNVLLGAWGYGQSNPTAYNTVTFSFMPDGTSIGGTPTNLAATMTAKGIDYKEAFRQAFAMWEGYCGLNFVEVADDGSPESTNGAQQGDARFGDIRIGSADLGTGSLAATFFPPPGNGGTSAGDILVNTNSSISWNPTTDYYLPQVADHEVGHAIGLAHNSNDVNDVMYQYYQGMNHTTPDTQDRTNLAGGYAPQTDDSYGPNNHS
jgi:predicted Zn-dependent protease